MSNFAHAETQPAIQHRHRRSVNGSFGGNDNKGYVNTPATTAQRNIPRITGDNVRADALGAARSPPKNKNTSHVPCKFYLQGQCQAGRMCPFSHDIESTTRPAPCKYFAKGHCKFGAKCALLHITQDGVVVNRRPVAPAPFPNNGHVLPVGFGAASQSLLSLQAQGLDPHTAGHYAPAETANNARMGSDVHLEYADASPTYGSPPHQNGAAMSPPKQRGLSVLDAPLPNSFDSNGISLAARNGPFAASMPSRFGLESPPASLPRNAYMVNPALYDLHGPTFGDHSKKQFGALNGCSPPSGDELLTFPKRSVHTERLHAAHAVFSASVGARPPPQSFEYSDEEPDTDQEESLLPASLRDLIPEGRSRRSSKTYKEDDTPASFLAAQRRTLSSTTTPQESKVGSPSFGSSPSRYSGMFAQRSASSDFIGSPLRNSGFTGVGHINRSMSNTDLSPAVSSPPRQASMSVLTQELQRTKLDAAWSQAGGYIPAAVPTRTLSNGSNGRTSLDRNLSSTSIGRERIDEEQDLFDMDELTMPAKATSRPRSSDVRPGEPSIGSRLFSHVARSEPNHGVIGSQRVR